MHDNDLLMMLVLTFNLQNNFFLLISFSQLIASSHTFDFARSFVWLESSREFSFEQGFRVFFVIAS
jgi:hypothetical protein